MSHHPTYFAGATPWIRTKRITRARNGKTVTSLASGESIAFVVYDNADDQQVATGSTPSDVSHWSAGTWAAKPAALPVGVYNVKWTVTVDGGVAVEWDRYEIVAGDA